MQAIRIHEFGGLETLRYEQVPEPEPGVGEARVKIEAIGVNYIDIMYRTGHYPIQPPVIIGSEAAGTIDAVGEDVDDLKTGDRVVYGMHLGAYANYATVPAEKLVPIPNSVDTAQAAAVFLQGLTAHYLSHSTYSLRPGDSVLIHAAAGGVGLLLVQMTKRLGARVIGTVSTEEKATFAREAGADDIILYTHVDFKEETMRLTDGEGVNVVYDSIGKVTFEKGLDCLKPRGCIALIGQVSGPVSPIDPQVLQNKGSLFLTRPSLRHHVSDRAELLHRARELFEWIVAGALNVRVDKTFPLAEAAEAHRYMEDRKTKGKLLLIP